jgi:hypothetical protein
MVARFSRHEVEASRDRSHADASSFRRARRSTVAACLLIAAAASVSKRAEKPSDGMTNISKAQSRGHGNDFLAIAL